MRAFLLLAALSATAPTPSEEHAAYVQLCVSANTHPVRRVVTCSQALDAGRLTRSELAGVYYARARARSDLGYASRAIDDFSDAIRLNPNHANAFLERGKLFEAMARAQAALRDYERAIALNPDFASALNSVAWLLATAPDVTLRDGERAIRKAQRALALVAYPAHRDTLAAAYAEAGRFEDAVDMQKSAIAALHETGRVLMLPAYERRLALYQLGQPFRSRYIK